MRAVFLAMLLGCAPKYDPGSIPVDEARAPVDMVTQLDSAAPNVYLQAMVRAGSASDRPGREGLAALTARALTEGGAGERTADDVRNALYPLGTSFDLRVDREWVTLRLTCHRDHASTCVDLFTDALVAPRFDEDAVGRLRDDATYAVTDGLLANEEALGEAALQAVLFEGHPYQHPPRGRAGSLEVLSAEDLRTFHQEHYLRSTVFVGVGGAIDAPQLTELASRLEGLPTRLPPDTAMFSPIPFEGRTLTVVRTASSVTGAHFGHPLELDRSHPDWPAVHLGLVAFGAHRQSFGRLFQTLRTDRGLNYGTYAYVEAYRERRGSSQPDPGNLRSDPHFSLWIRPTSLENGPFAIKLAIAELERLVDGGLEQDELDAVRSNMLNGLPTLAAEPSMQLAYALDAQATGAPPLLEHLPTAVADLDLETVNTALARHLDPSRLRIVAVSGQPEALVSALTSDTPTPIVYADVEPTETQAARDDEVARSVIGLTESWIVEGDGLFR